MKCFIWMVVLVSATKVHPDVITVQRHPRYLVFPRGTGNKLQIICGFGIPVDVPKTSLTYGLILKSNFQLPTNATQYTDPYVAFATRTAGASRWHLYHAFETLLSRLGLGGRSCLLRSVCEAAETPLEHNGILGELLYVILTPTSTEDEPIDETARDYYAAESRGRRLRSNSSENADCSRLYPECETGLLDLISTLVSPSVTNLF